MKNVIKTFLFVTVLIVVTSCSTMQELLDTFSSSLDNTFGNSSISDEDSSNSSSRVDTPSEWKIIDRRTTITSRQPNQTNQNRRADPDAENWDITTLDTAADVDYLTDVEKDVILETNKVRTNPKKYAELYIKPMLRYNWGGPFGANSYLGPGESIYTSTQEGVAAVNACIAALTRTKSVGILTPEKGLSLAAKDHVTDQSRTGQTGHNGSDRSTPVSRAGRYGKGQYIGENIAYGNSTGREIVCSLLIDDGVPSRGHRTNIMNKAYTQTGVGYGTHTQYRTSCTIAYANGYVSD